jgi:hypothetical protein
MARLLDKVLVCLYVALAAVPLVGMQLRIGHKSADGVVATRARPTPSAASFVSEQFQKDFTAWFETRLGFKNYAVFADNSLLYHLFGETKHGARVVIGHDGVLYEMDDLWYYSRPASALPAPGTIDAYAAKLARLQAALAARGKAFVPVIIPSKTSVYRNEVPPGWVLPLGQPRPTDDHVYGALVRALSAHGVRHVDAREMITTTLEPRALMWGPEARHWSEYAACLVMRDVFAHRAALLSMPPIDYPCPVTMTRTGPEHVDLDLWRLLNVWGVSRAAQVPSVASPSQLRGHRPGILLVGSSFCWTLLREAERSGLFGELEMNYYNKTFIAWPADVRVPAEPHTPAWREATFEKDVIVLDLFETYLFVPDGYSMQFVDQVGAALAGK